MDNMPCVTQLKTSLSKHYNGVLHTAIVAVIREIESWYLTGLNHHACIELDIAALTNTDTVTIEQFNALIPHRFGSRVDFMIEVLKRFSGADAKRKNTSFNYFANKHLA
jgi:hypothetical protein